MKLPISKEVEVNQGIPHYRWFVKDKNGVTVSSTKTRDEARNYVRKTKAEHAEPYTAALIRAQAALIRAQKERS